ncbi:hypothetical protein PanWU01x14_093200 [Parasponia andersonii]|uniref:Uncharacterized protein n=1 Tax=Parasponia andersonii TaxID=3476 RepID=A0A2P5D5X9_PARAD|nr:hypothetical protein PanWU01x14_093200 [Parasponia andersonii]
MSKLRATQIEEHATSSDRFDAEEDRIQSVPPHIDETLIATEALGVRYGHKTEVRRVLRGEMTTSNELRVLVLRTVPIARPSPSSNQPDQDDEDQYLDDD